MLRSVQKRLTTIFTSIIIGVNVLSMALILLYLHLSIAAVYQKHLAEDIEQEFIPTYRQGGLDKISELREEEYFQVLNRNGEILGGTVNSNRFTSIVDRELLSRASSGEFVFKTLAVDANHYLVSYFPLDEGHIGRIALPLNNAVEYEHRFLKLMLISLPGILVLSYLLSRLLVRHAMKPTIDAYKFQEYFLSNIAHELRSPLASIRGNLEVSLRKERPAEEYREVLQISLKETDRLIDLLKNLNLLASSEIEPLKLFDEQIDLRMVVSEVAKSYMPVIRSKEITLNNQHIADFICLCDEGLMKRAIENLFDNAVKYTPHGGVIRVSSSMDSRNIYLTIANTATDISKEEIQHLCEPFYRGKGTSNKKGEGQGLGLFIARYIIRSHHGDIKLGITDDHLFSVTVTLPHR